MSESLYTRLGGFDAISAVADNLVSRLRNDEQLGRFWQHRGEDGIRREKQLLVDFLCQSAGGATYYTGRNMELAHRGMGVSESDWNRFIGHLTDTLGHFNLAEREMKDVLDFIATTKPDIVEPQGHKTPPNSNHQTIPN